MDVRAGPGEERGEVTQPTDAGFRATACGATSRTPSAGSKGLTASSDRASCWWRGGDQVTPFDGEVTAATS